MNLVDRIFNGFGTDDWQRTALICCSRDGKEKTYSYKQLLENVNRMANMLSLKGIKPGDRVFVYMERVPELYFAVLGIIKCGAIYCPLFSSFGPDAVKNRISDCGGRAIITQEKLLNSINSIIQELESLEIIINLDNMENDDMGNDIGRFSLLPSEYTSFPSSDEDAAIIHYTSGTTGKPKGAIHCHGAVVGHYRTGREVLKLVPGEIYWCTADPAWVTGSSYGIFAPFACRTTLLACDPGYRIENFFSVIEKYKVNILYTAPTLLRMLMREDPSKIKKFDISSLKWVLSVGEALPVETIRWFKENTGLIIHDTWFQTETGSIMLANIEEKPDKLGSMGKPVGGIEAAILDDNYIPVHDNITGHLAVKPPWPSMFRGYWGNPEKYAGCFKNGWYITGDLARKDSDGYFWFASREDDVINTAGHLVSPFEIESVLAEHPSVAEVAVTGIPDEIMGEKVKAVIVLKEGFEQSSTLEMEYRSWIRKRVSPFAVPQVIAFASEMPKTESGKIIRKLLK